MSSQPPQNDSGAGESGDRVRIDPIVRTPTPVAAPRAADPGRSARRARDAGPGRWRLVIAGAFVLLVGAFALQFLSGEMPPAPPPSESPASSATAGDEPAAVPAPGDTRPAKPGPLQSSAGPGPAIDREQAARLLGEFQALAERLAPHAGRWANERYRSALALAREGEDALIADDPGRAGERFQSGLAILHEIDAETSQMLAETLEAGSKALAAEDGAGAREHFELAAAIDPDDQRAQRGLQRVASLNEVLGEMAAGAAREEQRDWSGARKTYTRALALDSDWKPAAEGLARVEARLAEARFEDQLSKGLQALAAGRLDEARESLKAALVLRPASREAKNALGQVEQEARLASIGRAQRDARNAEAREDWAAAVGYYEAALALDDDLRFAQDGLARSRERAALDERLRFLLEDPARLYSAAALREAQGLASIIQKVPDPGPRLREQQARLEENIARAATPISVAFASDNLTDVTIVQVRRLGTFDRLELDLRPGTYVVTGSRRGYRDVRTTLTVTPGEPVPTVVVRCTETI